MIVGRTEPGAGLVTAPQIHARQPDEGLYVRLGRDQARAALDQHPGRGRQTETLTIAQREYEIQRIDGLPGDKVTPPDDAVDRIARDNKLIAEARSHDTAEIWFASGLDWPVVGPITGVYGSQRILNGETAPAALRGRHRACGRGRADPRPQRRSSAWPRADSISPAAPRSPTTAAVSPRLLPAPRAGSTWKVGDKQGEGRGHRAIGKTGRATGPHLCWRLNWFQERLDLSSPPADAWLKTRRARPSGPCPSSGYAPTAIARDGADRRSSAWRWRRGWRGISAPFRRDLAI